MKKFRKNMISATAALLSLPAVAAGDLSTASQAMTPEAMQGMMGGQTPINSMPMMGRQGVMNPQMMQQMPMMNRQQWGNPMGYQQQVPYGMMDNRHGSMMNPQLMQQMMESKQNHMRAIEKHLAGIEASLKELVELQKSR